MKRILIAGGLAALIAGGVAMAQDGPRGGRQADADNDGRISQAEFAAAAAARFDRSDANRDGTITPDEVQAARQARMAERREGRFARLDANSDGSISRAEFDAVSERRAEGRDEGRGPRGGRHGQRGGRGGWGGGMEAEGVTRAELDARTATRFARMDANGDGFLTAEDRQARRGARGAAASE